MGFQVAYVPIGVGTFHLESAQDQFEKSVSMLRGLEVVKYAVIEIVLC